MSFYVPSSARLGQYFTNKSKKCPYKLSKMLKGITICYYLNAIGNLDALTYHRTHVSVVYYF